MQWRTEANPLCILITEMIYIAEDNTETIRKPETWNTGPETMETILPYGNLVMTNTHFEYFSQRSELWTPSTFFRCVCAVWKIPFKSCKIGSQSKEPVSLCH